MINKVILIGNLGRDPEFRTVGQSATPTAQLSLATTRRYRTPDGQTAEETEWHRVVFFGRQAEVARDYLRKGRQIYVEGRLKTRKWTDKEGRDNYTTEVIGDTFQMLGRRDDAQQGGQAGQSYGRPQSQQAASAYDDGDTPF